MAHVSKIYLGIRKNIKTEPNDDEIKQKLGKKDINLMVDLYSS
jgi:hypothetical protein